MDMSSEVNDIAQARELASVSNAKLRVIVVDDDALFCQMLTAELEEHGFSVRVFADGQALLRNPDIAVDTDIIVLDWNLPKMSGIDLCRIIRRDQLIKLPVLFLTANAGAQDMVDAFASGADDYMVKPFHAPELGARIFSLLRRTRA